MVYATPTFEPPEDDKCPYCGDEDCDTYCYDHDDYEEEPEEDEPGFSEEDMLGYYPGDI